MPIWAIEMEQNNQVRFSDEFEYQLVVGPDDIDEMNHVNNLQYLRWTLRAAVAHSSHVGWTPERYRRIGFGFIVRSHNIKYRVPALLNDTVVVKTWIESLEKVSSVRRYLILRESDRAQLATAETNWVFVDLKTLELARIFEDIKTAFRPNVS